MGSGDDDEDDGQEDSVTETENDQVYFSRGMCYIKNVMLPTYLSRKSA